MERLNVDEVVVGNPRTTTTTTTSHPKDVPARPAPMPGSEGTRLSSSALYSLGRASGMMYYYRESYPFLETAKPSKDNKVPHQ